MNDPLSLLSTTYGIEDSYVSADGEYRRIPDDVKLGLLDAMGVDKLGLAPRPSFESRQFSSRAASKCYVPDWLHDTRIWGVATQLYAVSSRRNQGIGDFEDLAQLAEKAAARGADFAGINPVHALFSADPDRCSPYFPSTRQFLNPLYIAIDKVPDSAPILEAADQDLLARLRRSQKVDYRAVATLKHRLLRDIFEWSSSQRSREFLNFCKEQGEALEGFARFEALSALMAAKGTGSGWREWPEDLHDSKADAVAHILSDEEQTILWHKWMQWLAHEQLVDAQRRALDAGMRIGLYLDIAVGVAPDGAATWSDPTLVTTKARIGCPPDIFNPLGQDWGLAPIIPSKLQDRGLEPFEHVLRASAKYAGAVRVDHAMALERLYWIPHGFNARQGGYVRYPREELLDVLSYVSQQLKTIIIGEDLGTVPNDFREQMREREIHSYRVFYFERTSGEEFTAPHSYPEMALACIGTHDLPTIAGWWTEGDITTRSRLALISEDEAIAERTNRQQSRRQLLVLLANSGFEHSEEEAASEEPSQAVVADLHACIASGPSRLFAVQLDDLVGTTTQTNIPGTHTEYPNWRMRLPFMLEELFEFPLVTKTLEAVARVRARQL
jgi:4-alpha-glucanotransferase